MPRSGGDSFLDRIGVILKFISYGKVIHNIMKTADVVHFRMPSIPGLIGIILNFYFNIKKGWIKYAGTWTEKAPLSYLLQRNILKYYKILPVTILSKRHALNNLYFLPNPCLSETELKKNNLIASKKNSNEKINLLFVGSLQNHKSRTINRYVFKSP